MFIRQFVMNPNPNLITPLLNDVGQTAAGAWGFRLLDKNYTGDCCVVKRLAGNNMDIGFVPDGFGNMVVDEQAIINFCGGTIGTIRKMLDQSGNGRDLDGGGTPSSPIIYDGANIIKVNGRPAMDHGVNEDRVLRLSGFAIPNTNTTISMRFSTTGVDASSRRIFALTETDFNNGSLIAVANTGGSITFSVRYPTPQVSITSGANAIGAHTYFANKNGSNFISVGLDGGALLTNINTQTNTTVRQIFLGGNEADTLGNSFNGLIQEFIWWNVDASPSRTTMTNNLTTFYGV